MNWQIENKALTKEFGFKNFTQAVGFINKIHDIAEKLGHHPNILLHSYNKVKIMLYTHSENKITDKDYLLAERIDSILEK